VKNEECTGRQQPQLAAAAATAAANPRHMPSAGLRWMMHDDGCGITEASSGLWSVLYLWQYIECSMQAAAAAAAPVCQWRCAGELDGRMLG
jgi:hypothetical protein